MSILQSFAWGGFRRSAPDDNALLDAAVRLGYAGIDFLPEALWAAAQDKGLALAAIVGHQSLRDGLNRRENHDRITAEITANLEKAALWKIHSLIVFSGDRREGLTDDEGAEITAEGLRRVAPLAEQAGVTLILELLNSKVDHAGYQADRTTWGARVCEMVASPRVKLLYDIYHMQIMEGDVIATLRAFAPHIGHYHTAGVPGRRDIDETQELYYPAIVRAIQETGYAGYLAHEFTPSGDPLTALEAAFRTCSV